MATQEREKLIINIVSYTALVLLGGLLILFIAGDTFRPVLSFLGLYHSETGLYADCSKPENRKNKFCTSPVSNPVRELESAKSGGYFSLTDP